MGIGATTPYSIIGTDVNEPDYGDCDFEIDESERKAEPRPAARGEIARTIFYMHSEYGLPIEPSLFKLLIGWHEADEVSAEEMRRILPPTAALQDVEDPGDDSPVIHPRHPPHLVRQQRLEPHEVLLG